MPTILLNSLTVETNPEDSNGNSNEDENDAKDKDMSAEKQNAEDSRIEPVPVSAKSDAIDADGEEGKDDSIQVLLSSMRVFRLFTLFSQL